MTVGEASTTQPCNPATVGHFKQNVCVLVTSIPETVLPDSFTSLVKLELFLPDSKYRIGVSRIVKE